MIERRRDFDPAPESKTALGFPGNRDILGAVLDVPDLEAVAVLRDSQGHCLSADELPASFEDIRGTQPLNLGTSPTPDTKVTIATTKVRVESEILGRLMR